MTGHLERNQKIKIVENGPYIVTGNVPLAEKIIVLKKKAVNLQKGASCRNLKNMPSVAAAKQNMHPFVTTLT